MTFDLLTLSLRVTVTALILMLPVGTWLAYWMAKGREFIGKSALETLLLLPLVLPPTVVGFGLLVVLGRGTSFGDWLNTRAGISLLFTWQGAAVAASIMALPLFVKSAATAFGSVDREYLEAGRIQGASEWCLFWSILVPLSKSGLAAGLSLASARAIGEFGATLMVAGSIPGKTQTMPLALYEAVQSGQDGVAWSIALSLAFASFGLLSLVGFWEKRRE